MLQVGLYLIPFINYVTFTCRECWLYVCIYFLLHFFLIFVCCNLCLLDANYLIHLVANYLSISFMLLVLMGLLVC